VDRTRGKRLTAQPSPRKQRYVVGRNSDDRRAGQPRVAEWIDVARTHPLAYGESKRREASTVIVLADSSEWGG
jgi:hypothetical protein